MSAMRHRDSIGRERHDVTGRYSPGTRVLAFCLLFAAVAWDHAACVPGLNDLPALLCRRLGHHSGPALAGMPCCPPPASLPAQRASQQSCCEAPEPSQDAIPSTKEDGTRNAACSMRVIVLAPPPGTGDLPVQLHRGSRYEHKVFDLKMDMRT
jgi:hypothetical protein